MRLYMVGSVVLVTMLLGVLATSSVSAETETERRERLELQLQQVERQILTQRILVEDKRNERQSLERDVELLDAQIRQAELGIEARSAAILNLEEQIQEKEDTVAILNERLGTQQASLAVLLRQTQSLDDFSLIEVLLSNKSFSQFFSEADQFRVVKDHLNDSLDLLKQIKSDTQLQKNILEEKQLSESELKRAQELEKRSIEQKEEQKNSILTVTKGEEDAYQQLLETQQKTAAQLKAQLFELLGGGGPIPFPQAVELAQNAEALTGTPAALILAILEQESSYGSNIGSCTMNDLSLGQEIMHPDRDMPVFRAIAEQLGFDTDIQQVSCPLRRSDGTRIGWGGAMGPSQFIPSTWAIYGGYENVGGGWQYNQSKDAIKSLLGKSSPSNPFVNQDAFVATALLLRDNGANGSYDSDRMAALRYYAGWGGATRPENSFYGDQVMQRKARLAGDIKTLTSN